MKELDIIVIDNNLDGLVYATTGKEVIYLHNSRKFGILNNRRYRVIIEEITKATPTYNNGHKSFIVEEVHFELKRVHLL